jgi:hypothetical protein
MSATVVRTTYPAPVVTPLLPTRPGAIERSSATRGIPARFGRDERMARSFHLEHGAIDDEVRALARSGGLVCPYPRCRDPEFIAWAAESGRRHHFAHPVAGEAHSTSEIWRYQAFLMLSTWITGTRPDLKL